MNLSELSGIQNSITPEHKMFWGQCFREMAQSIPVMKPSLPISEHAEEYRTLPQGDRYYGPLRLDRSPYLREIMNNMSPKSSVRHTVVMKGAQLGFTMALECIMCYYIGYSPADQLLVTASTDLYKRWVGRRLEPAINSYEYREKIFAQERRGSGKQSGDKIATKEYVGGQLDLVSAQSASSLRALSKRILLRDEIDGSKEELDTKEGSFLDVSMARTKAWGYLAKIIDISTPTVSGQSAVERLYNLGDKRQYYMPCPHCSTPFNDKFQVLKWRNFKPVIEDKILKDVFYQCEFCGDEIFEFHKREMFKRSEWRPTAKAQKLMTRSYHIPSWYAPLGISPWPHIFDAYQNAQGNAEKMSSFWNLEGGIPSINRGARPKLEKVIGLQGQYQSGTVPDGVLFLTMSVDVQQGSKGDPKNPARLELEICGHGVRWRTWSILYKVFKGSIDDIYSGAWGDLTAWAKENELTFERADGMLFPVSIIFIDSKDGTKMDLVYKFTGNWRNTYPISGFGGPQLRQRKGEKGDELTTSNLKRFRVAKMNDVLLVQISTNYYKTNLYNNLNIQRRDYDPQPPGFCDFPADYKEKYFRMLTAEEQRKDGSFHAGGRRNETLDLRIMNLCAGDLHLDQWTDRLREQYKKDYPAESLKYVINIDFTLRFLAKQVGVDYELYIENNQGERKKS